MKTIFTFIISIVSINLFGQCFMERHSTTWYDSWVSCESSPSPNEIRGDGHWILYNLGYNYALGESYWWNANNPNSLNDGIKNIVIDISEDGKEWVELTKFELPMASGINTYEGIAGPYFDKNKARYILLTALDNYGGPCYSFGEMKINVDLISAAEENGTDNYCSSISAYPNPFSQTTKIVVNSNCENQSQLSDLLRIEDALGRTVFEQKLNLESTTIDFNGSELQSGIYFVKINGGAKDTVRKLIKVN